MSNSLRVLIVEDFESDAELILRQLTKAGYVVTSERVETGSGMEAALTGATWDVVISDFKLPQFDAPAALALLKKSGRDIPFIAVSGTIGEETAAALMKAGAHDYLMKDNLTRLAPVVARELSEARRRDEYRLSEQRVRESEARYRVLFENSPNSLWEEDYSGVKKFIESLRAKGVTDFREYFAAHPRDMRKCAGKAKVLDTNQTSLDLYKAGSKAELLLNLTKIIPQELIDPFEDELVMIAEGRLNFEYETVNYTLKGERIDISLNWAVVTGHEEDLSRVIISIQDISERKRAEKKLRQAEIRLRSLVEQMPAIVYTELADEPGNIIYMSPQIEELTGFSPSEWLADPYFWKKIIYVDDLELFYSANEETNRTGEPFRMTYRLVTRDGRTVWVRDEAVLIRDENSGQSLFWQGVIHDITETKQAEAVTQRHLSELEVLYQNSLAINRLMEPKQIASEVIEILQSELHWHHITFRLYNVKTGKLELLAVNQPGLSPDELSIQEKILSEAITERAIGLSGWVYRNGQAVRCPRVREDSRYIETHPDVFSGLYVPLRTGERIIGSISVESNDENAFTEQDERLLTTLANQAAVSIENAQLFLTAKEELATRKQAEIELLQAHDRLEQRVVERTADLKAANLALEKAARLKDEFLASMSHELRTPLTGILGLSEVLQLQTYGELSEKQLAALKHIAASGRQLLDLINDMLDLSRIEARQLVLRFGPCQLDQVCRASLQAIFAQANQKKLHASFAMTPSSIILQADMQRLKQMLANLLSNAVKFSSPGGSFGIEVSGSPADHLVHITVWDTGIGIRSEDLPRLFQSFVQLDASLERQYNGTGLGLALVKRLVDLHGGSIKVQSSFGAGSRFTLSLPWDG